MVDSKKGVASSVGPGKCRNLVQVVNKMKMEWSRLQWYFEVSTRAIWVFMILIQSEKENTAFRDIGPEMDSAPVTHLGDE